MKKTNFQGEKFPSMSLAINKSRMKLYNKKSDLPIYYLKKGQEFQLEIFNPTSNVILAQISLNNKLISQGGLVLRPGERVFLDRYLEIDKKFLFDTYDVDDTKSVRKAIRDNGDIQVEFFKEKLPTYNGWPISLYHTGTTNIPYNVNFTTNNLGYATLTSTGTVSDISFASTRGVVYGPTGASGPMGSAGIQGVGISTKEKDTSRNLTRSKSIETGRVEMGGTSNQKLELTNKEFEAFSFHTIRYKLLPTSQQKVESKDLMKVYCTECGNKNKPSNKFCPNCGTKQ